MGIGQEILDVPFGQMVYQVASAIAESQAALDRNSIEMLKVMGDDKNSSVLIPMLDEHGNDVQIETSMIGAGFQPTFYQFSDAIIEVKMAISMSNDSDSSWSKETEYGPSTSTSISLNRGRINVQRSTVKASTINASYTNKFSFKEEASSTLRVRLVPLPPNPMMQRLIELRAQAQQLQYEENIKQMEISAQGKTTGT